MYFTCTRRQWVPLSLLRESSASTLPPGVERRPEQADETRALPRAAIERQLSRRDVPLREKTLWRMLYETATRANEVLALNIDDLDLEGRRPR